MSDKLGQLEYDLTIDEQNLDKKIKEIDATLKAASSRWEKDLSISTKSTASSVNSLSKAAQRQFQGQFTESIKSLTTKNDQLKIMAAEYSRLEKISQEAAKAEQSRIAKELANREKAAKKALEIEERRIAKEIAAEEKLAAKKAKAAQASFQGQFKESIADLTRQSDQLKKMSTYYKQLEKDTDAYYNSLTKEAKEAANAERKHAQELDKAAIKAEKLAEKKHKEALAQKRNTKAVRDSNSAYKKQSLYLQNLNTLAASYASIFAVGRIADKIREVTGEFELQNKALAAILQNKEKADQLFGQVTDLALKSPFAIKELLTYTKQLAAYRIETESLIPTLTQLADVSAGLGVDMSRLILAYGQVRAASVLRGTELRQFTEAGIPLVQLLADKFSILEGRVVDTNEVFDKISNRMVSFAMVSEIFEDMTSQGGIFFEAQAVQAKTLAGMWNILGDAIDKAMFAMGTENMDLLKGAVQGATDLARSWEDVLKVLRSLVIVFGVYKTSQIALAVSQKLVNSLTFTQRRNLVGMNRAMKAATITTYGLRNAMASLKAVSGQIVISGILLLASALYDSYKEANRFNNELKDLTNSEFLRSDKLVSGFTEMADAAKNAADGSKDQRDALSDLNRVYKDYLPKQTLTINGLRDLTDGYDEVTAAINRKVEAQAREKAAQAIESEFQKRESEAVGGFLEGLASLEVSDEVANKIAQDFKAKIDENLSKGYAFSATSILKDVVKEITGINKEFITGAQGGEGAIANLSEQATIYSRVLIDVADATKKANKEISAKFSIPTGQYAEEIDALKKFKDEYTKTIKEIDATGNLTDAQIDEKKLDAQKKQIESAIQLYKDLSESAKTTGDSLGKVNYYGKKIEEAEVALSKLTVTQDAYKQSIQEIIKEQSKGDGAAGFEFRVTDQDGSIPKHLERVAKAYKSLTKEVDIQRKAVETLGSVEGDKEYNDLKILELKKRTAKAILDENKYRLEGVDFSKVAVDNLKAQVKLYTDIKKAREDLSKSLGIGDTEVQISDIFKGRAEDLGVKIPITSDPDAFYDQLKDIAKQAEKLGTDAGKALSKSINQQISKGQTKDLVDNAKQALKDIDDEVKSYKGKVDFYNDILGISKDEEFSFKLAFDVDTDGLERLIRDKIASLDKGIELSISEDVVGKSFEDVFSEDEISALTSRVGEDQVNEIKKLYSQLSEIQNKSFKDELTRLYKVREEFQSTEQQKTAIRAKYAKLRADLDSEYNNQTLEEREETLRRLSESEGLELAKIDATILASTKAYKALYSDMERYSVNKMKSIRDEWEDILGQIDNTKAVNGFTTITFVDEGQLKTLTLTEEQIENLRKATVKLNKEISEKNPFEKISKGFEDTKGGEFSEGLELAGEGVSELLGMIDPLIDALEELAEATGDTGMANFADDLRIASQWGNQLIGLGTGIAKAAAGDPTALIQSAINITTTLIKAEAAYQEAKRAFLADQLKMEREYVLLLLQEQALFKDGLSIFDVNQFGQANNQINVLRSATAAYRDEIQKLSDAEVKIGVKRKKVFGVTVGKKDIYGSLLEAFPEIVKNQDDIIKKTEDWALQALGLEKTYYEIGENAEIDVNVAKSILATEKLNAETRATLEQLIALQEQIDAANQAISDYLGNVFGQLGADLSDALVEAFRAGDQASLDFASNVSSTMEKLAQDIGNSLILAPYFKEFENKLNEIYKDGSLTPEEQFAATSKVMADFYAGLKAEQDEYAEFLAQAQEEAAKYGLDIFGDQTDELGALAKGIEGVTEDTARRLEAMLNSIREISIVDSGRMSEIVSGINIQSAIATQSIAHLQSIDNTTMAIKGAIESVLTNAQNTGGTGFKVYIQ